MVVNVVRLTTYFPGSVIPLNMVKILIQASHCAYGNSCCPNVNDTLLSGREVLLPHWASVLL